MNKKYTIVVALLALTLLFLGLYFKVKNKIQRTDLIPPVITQTSSSTPIVATSTISNVPIKASYLQPTPYTDTVAKFSIYLPKDWAMDDKEISTTSLNTWFHNTSSIGDSDMKFVIGRYERTDNTNKIIDELGPGGLIDKIVFGIVSSLNLYSQVSTQSVTIKDIPYRQVISTYVGKETKRQVTQYLYVTLAKDAYYLVGIDVYTDIWEKNKNAILQSINTLKLH